MGARVSHAPDTGAGSIGSSLAATRATQPTLASCITLDAASPTLTLEQGSIDSSLARMVAPAPSVTLFSLSSGVSPAGRSTQQQRQVGRQVGRVCASWHSTVPARVLEHGSRGAAPGTVRGLQGP